MAAPGGDGPAPDRPLGRRRSVLLVLAIVALAAVVVALGPPWQPRPGLRTFEVDGHLVTVGEPAVPAPGRPWVWYGAWRGWLPDLDRALLDHGIAVVDVAVPDQFGSPGAMHVWEHVWEHLVADGFSPRPALIGVSRGGLYVYAWAAAHPDRVACIYGDAPVMDVRSWPGGRGTGVGDPLAWADFKRVFGLVSDADALAWTGNPVDHLEPLARARIPILHVVGEADTVVPWQENTGEADARYRALGGTFVVLAKPGAGHQPHGLPDPTPLVDFLVGCTLPTPELRLPRPGATR